MLAMAIWKMYVVTGVVLYFVILLAYLMRRRY
jgi:hypothetical protein